MKHCTYSKASRSNLLGSANSGLEEYLRCLSQCKNIMKAKRPFHCRWQMHSKRQRENGAQQRRHLKQALCTMGLLDNIPFCCWPNFGCRRVGGDLAKPVWPPPGLLHGGHGRFLHADRPQEDQGSVPAEGQQEPRSPAGICQASRPCLRFQRQVCNCPKFSHALCATWSASLHK